MNNNTPCSEFASANKCEKKTVAQLLASSNNKASFLKFLNASEAEFNTLRHLLQESENEALFVQCLLNKLDGTLYQVVDSASPRTFAVFRRALLRSTSFIRLLTVIKAEATSSLQALSETPLDYIHRLEALRKEFRLAARLKFAYEITVAAQLQDFDGQVLEWAPNGKNFGASFLKSFHHPCNSLNIHRGT